MEREPRNVEGGQFLKKLAVGAFAVSVLVGCAVNSENSLALEKGTSSIKTYECAGQKTILLAYWPEDQQPKVGKMNDLDGARELLPDATIEFDVSATDTIELKVGQMNDSEVHLMLNCEHAD